jgi:hypothetical protein
LPDRPTLTQRIECAALAGVCASAEPLVEWRAVHAVTWCAAECRIFTMEVGGNAGRLEAFERQLAPALRAVRDDMPFSVREWGQLPDFDCRATPALYAAPVRQPRVEERMVGGATSSVFRFAVDGDGRASLRVGGETYSVRVDAAAADVGIVARPMDGAGGAWFAVDGAADAVTVTEGDRSWTFDNVFPRVRLDRFLARIGARTAAERLAAFDPELVCPFAPGDVVHFDDAESARSGRTALVHPLIREDAALPVQATVQRVATTGAATYRVVCEDGVVFECEAVASAREWARRRPANFAAIIRTLVQDAVDNANGAELDVDVLGGAVVRASLRSLLTGDGDAARDEARRVSAAYARLRAPPPFVPAAAPNGAFALDAPDVRRKWRLAPMGAAPDDGSAAHDALRAALDRSDHEDHPEHGDVRVLDDATLAELPDVARTSRTSRVRVSTGEVYQPLPAADARGRLALWNEQRDEFRLVEVNGGGPHVEAMIANGRARLRVLRVQHQPPIVHAALEGNGGGLSFVNPEGSYYRPGMRDALVALVRTLDLAGEVALHRGERTVVLDLAPHLGSSALWRESAALALAVRAAASDGVVCAAGSERVRALTRKHGRTATVRFQEVLDPPID